MDETKCQEDQGTKQTESYLNDLRDGFKRCLRSPKFFVELLALIGLVLYTCETRRTNNLTENGLNNAKRSSADSTRLTQLEERAWFGPSKTELKFRHQPKPGEQVPFRGEFLEARIQFINTGRTPALNVRIATNGFVAPIDFGPKGEQYIGVGSATFSPSINSQAVFRQAE